MTTVYKPLHTHHTTTTTQFLSRQTFILFFGGECLAGRRGSRPWGKVLYGHTWLETPDPVRSPKLSNHRRVQYSGGGPPGKRTYCTAHKQPFFETILVLVPRRARTRRGQTLGTWHLDLVSCVLFSLGTSCLSMSVPNSYPGRPRVWPGAGARGPGGMSRITSGSRLARLRLILAKASRPEAGRTGSGDFFQDCYSLSTLFQ